MPTRLLMAFCVFSFSLSSAFAADQTTIQRVLIYGDAGAGDSGQYQVASGMLTSHRQQRFDFAVSVGDNLYSPWQSDTFRQVFELPYAPLIQDGVRFYQVAGNHDMEDNKLAEELAYSNRVNAEERGVGGWVMHGENYVITKGNTRWIFINPSKPDASMNWTPTIASFAEANICQPFSGWKFLVVHYPLWSTNFHGDSPDMQKRFLPILTRCPVDMVFAGHDHHAEYIHPWSRIPFLTLGNGHEAKGDVAGSARESLFSYRNIGFGSLLVLGDIARMAFHDATGRELYAFSWQRQLTVWSDVWRQEGRKILARLSVPSAQSSLYEVEIGFATDAADPIWHPESYRFVAATYDKEGNAPVLSAFAATIPDNFNSGVAVSRYRLRGSDVWIYGDLSDGAGLHGNYDGIQLNHLLTFRR